MMSSHFRTNLSSKNLKAPSVSSSFEKLTNKNVSCFWPVAWWVILAMGDGFFHGNHSPNSQPAPKILI